MSRYGKMTLVAAVALAALVGCEPEPQKVTAPFPQEFLQDRWEKQEVPVAHIVRRDYRLREGDQLEIIYHVKHVKSPSYRIKIQDEVVVRFPFEPKLNQIERVNSDGTMQLDLVGSVPVFDRTIDEVREELIRRYSKYVRNPVVTVSFKESNKKIAELRLAITTAPRGQSRLVPITPDGTISLPFIVDIRAAGKTVGELHKDLNGAYGAVGLADLEVTVNVQSVAPMRVFVLGEVRIPGALLNKTGAIQSNHELTLLQAIAQAGSYLPKRAELSKVMLVRRRHLSRPQAAIVNVFQLLENRKRESLCSGSVKIDMRNYRYDIWLEDGDIVYVPTSDIAKRADYIEYVWERGIRNVGGFSTSASIGYSIGDAVDWLGPNPN